MMKQFITAKILFEEFIDQIKIAVKVVVSQFPYAQQQIVSIVLSLVKTLGIYYNEAKEWRSKGTINKTWKK